MTVQSTSSSRQELPMTYPKLDKKQKPNVLDLFQRSFENIYTPYSQQLKNFTAKVLASQVPEFNLNFDSGNF